MLLHQCYLTIISLRFRDILCVLLGLGVGIWLGLNFQAGMLFQDQQNVLTQELV